MTERFGLTPEKYLDYVALKGDASDNIPGVPGVGEKTAAKLVQDFGSVEELLTRTDELKGKLKENDAASVDQLALNKELAQLVTDVGLPVEPDDCVMGEWDVDDVRRLFTSLEFRTLFDRLEEVGQRPSPPSRSPSSTCERSRWPSSRRSSRPARRRRPAAARGGPRPGDRALAGRGAGGLRPVAIDRARRRLPDGRVGSEVDPRREGARASGLGRGRRRGGRDVRHHARGLPARSGGRRLPAPARSARRTSAPTSSARSRTRPRASSSARPPGAPRRPRPPPWRCSPP